MRQMGILKSKLSKDAQRSLMMGEGNPRGASFLIGKILEEAMMK